MIRYEIIKHMPHIRAIEPGAHQSLKPLSHQDFIEFYIAVLGLSHVISNLCTPAEK